MPGFASAALFYRSLLHRMPMAEDDRSALRAHQDVHEAIGRLAAGDPADEVAAIRAWVGRELGRPASVDDPPAYTEARFELLELLNQALSPSRPVTEVATACTTETRS